MPSLVALGLLAACSRDIEMYPVGPGGGPGPGGTSTVDATVGNGGDGGSELAGRVCLVSDARAPLSCASTGAAGITVTLGSQTATTTETGAFAITRPVATNLVWRVSGASIEPSALQYTGDALIPAVDENLYADMIAGMNATVLAGNGALIARVTTAGSPVPGVLVTPSPLPDSETYYDGASATDWGFDSTGPFGVAWMSSITAGTVQLSLATTGGQTDVTGIQVFADTITFVFAEIP